MLFWQARSFKICGVAAILTAMGPDAVPNMTYFLPIGIVINPKRRVFVIKWGQTGKRKWSFHHTLLVTDDSGDEYISSLTTGVIFDWGSIVAGKRVTSGVPVKVKPFNSDEYHIGIAMRNEYEFVGWTDWDDKSIEGLGKQHAYHLLLMLPLADCCGFQFG